MVECAVVAVGHHREQHIARRVDDQRDQVAFAELAFEVDHPCEMLRCGIFCRPLSRQVVLLQHHGDIGDLQVVPVENLMGWIRDVLAIREQPAFGLHPLLDATECGVHAATRLEEAQARPR